MFYDGSNLPSSLSGLGRVGSLLAGVGSLPRGLTGVSLAGLVLEGLVRVELSRVEFS